MLMTAAGTDAAGLTSVDRGHYFNHLSWHRDQSGRQYTPGNTAADGTTRYYYYNDLPDTAYLPTQGGTGALAKTIFTPNDANGTTITTTTACQYWDDAKQLTRERPVRPGY